MLGFGGNSPLYLCPTSKKYSSNPAGANEISIFAGTKGLLDSLPVSEVLAFEEALLRHFEDEFPELTVYLKVEAFNPGGSLKDRPVRRMLLEAERYYASAHHGLPALPWRAAWAVATAPNGCWRASHYVLNSVSNPEDDKALRQALNGPEGRWFSRRFARGSASL